MNTIIHAAFRRDLARFDAALERFPAGARARAGELGVAWTHYARQLHHHHGEEETIFFPALRALGADGALLDDLGREHARILAALDVADSAMGALRADPSAIHAQRALEALAVVREALEAHLAHEEADLEPVHAATAETPLMREAEAAVRRRMRGEMGAFFAWLTDGAEPGVRAGLHKVVPAPVLFVLCRLAGRGYRRRVAAVWA